MQLSEGKVSCTFMLSSFEMSNPKSPAEIQTNKKQLIIMPNSNSTVVRFCTALWVSSLHCDFWRRTNYIVSWLSTAGCFFIRLKTRTPRGPVGGSQDADLWIWMQISAPWMQIGRLIPAQLIIRLFSFSYC